MGELLASIAAKKERLDALEHASLRDDLQPFQTFMRQRLDATLGEYLSALGKAQTPEPGRDKPNRDV
jgi:hypothetical protein